MNWTKSRMTTLRLLSLCGLILFILLMWPSCIQEKPTPNQFETYIEADDPSPDPDADWEALGSGLHATLGSIDVRYPKSSIPGLSSTAEWQGTAWIGEKVSAQLVLWSRDPIEKVECFFSDFISEQGQKLSSEIARARFVRYVLTDEFAEGCSKREPEDYLVSLSPDALDNAAFFNMEGKQYPPCLDHRAGTRGCCARGLFLNDAAIREGSR